MDASRQADKVDKKVRLKAWREEEHHKARALYPLEDARLEAFFTALEELRSRHGCFHDLRHALHVSETMGLTEPETDSLMNWCNEHGGYCDCEIAANTFMHWHQTREKAGE